MFPIPFRAYPISFHCLTPSFPYLLWFSPPLFLFHPPLLTTAYLLTFCCLPSPPSTPTPLPPPSQPFLNCWEEEERLGHETKCQPRVNHLHLKGHLNYGVIFHLSLHNHRYFHVSQEKTVNMDRVRQP